MRNSRFGLIVLLAASCLFASDNGRGAKITVRTNTSVSSDRSQFGDPVEAVLVNDLVVNGKVVAPRGSPARAIVSAADPSTNSGRNSFPGSISIRLDTVETPEGIYHLSTNQYTRQGRGRSHSPLSGGTVGGISIGSVGGVQTQRPVPVQDPNGVNLSSGSLEAIIPADSVITFKAAAVSSPSPKK